MDADQLATDPMTAAARLLNATLTAGPVAVRIVEVEAYGSDPAGPWPDPAAHSYPGPTPRNRVMFGPPGRLYVYLSYGIHRCVNVVCGPAGSAGAVLIRAGEVVAGEDVVRGRRPTVRRSTDLARGPGNLGRALGISLDHYGVDLFATGAPVQLRLGGRVTLPAGRGPRVGVSVAAERRWRLWVPSSPAISAYRRSPRAPAVVVAEGSGA